GAGGVGAPREALQQESAALDTLLDRLGAAQGRRRAPASGLLLLVSSAGGVHGKSGDLPITEDSPPSPISEYGRNKLSEEVRVSGWVKVTAGVRCLIARVSNLYGPGQDLVRSPGLISRLAQHLIHGAPLNIYVPLDTLRDYVYAEDAARYILRSLRRLGQHESPTSLVKIVAAERSLSIAGVIGIFSRVAKRRPRIICM